MLDCCKSFLDREANIAAIGTSFPLTSQLLPIVRRVQTKQPTNHGPMLHEWIRSNKLIVCLFRLATGLFYQLFAPQSVCIRSGDRVCKLVAGQNDARCWDDDIIPVSPNSDDPDGAFVFGHQRHVIAGHQFLELRNRCQLLLTEHSMLCSIKRLEGHEFVIEHMPVMGKITTAMRISNEDAIVLLANGYCAIHCDVGETLILSSYSEAEKSHINSSMLATLPLVLQVKGYNFAAAFVSLVILSLDLFRTPISRAYARIHDFILVWAKLNVLRSWSQGYEILSIFSMSWLYSDQNAKCMYKSKGPFYCIHGSILNKDGFTQCYDSDDLEHMFKIERERAQWLPTPTDINLGAPFLFNNELLVS
ncbi:hypothetical protein GOP47_0005094 [Adiantum capillus-veneris]|uniref:Uncharacterized protein n=1 Tax=Adiantum capillus-veneris TaxID=13818 RepID=A0A9D4ZNU3_ADICA|nr:hypothetical protein GOP47_0005094 [Adiantum capillus-veneris]